MLKELREEVVLNVLLNNESEFEEYCKEKCDFNCLSSNIDYIYHLLDKAEIEMTYTSHINMEVSSINEFSLHK